VASRAGVCGVTVFTGLVLISNARTAGLLPRWPAFSVGRVVAEAVQDKGPTPQMILIALR
jgi:hypothetical protein